MGPLLYMYVSDGHNRVPFVGPFETVEELERHLALVSRQCAEAKRVFILSQLDEIKSGINPFLK